VHQQQPLQIPELSEGIVTGHDGLHSFLSTYSDPNVGSCGAEGEETVDHKLLLSKASRPIHTWCPWNSAHKCSAHHPHPQL
jgi:hypothetical protein